jgi:LCP family protein required for cell wall assembly
MLLGVIAIAGMLLFPTLNEFWNRPLGPVLGFEESPTVVINPEVATETPLPIVGLDLSIIHTKEPTVTPTAAPQPFCGGPEVLVVMAVGIDYRRDNYIYGLADLIKIVRVDFVTPRVTVLSIPRDLWVEVPDISDHYGITHTKLNQAYFFGTEGMGYYDGPGLGAGLLARTLEINFGIRPDHYGVINMATFEDIVNGLGGIDVYLPHVLLGEPGAEKGSEDYFPEGWNHLNGFQALKFARIRQTDSVFNRMDRQTQVLCALREKILSPTAMTNLPEIIESFTGRVLTDLSPAQISQMACLLPKLEAGGIQFVSFPTDIFEGINMYDPTVGHDTFFWRVDFGIMREHISRFLSGEWPEVASVGGEADPRSSGSQKSCENFP